MAERQNIASGTTWENFCGYSRAVRVGNIVHVAGTTATDADGNLVGGDSAYEQAKFTLQKIERALNEAGASISDVVRTRVYVTNADEWREVCKAHSEVFDTVRPVNTLVEVSRLIGEEYLVEIEAEAIIQDNS